MAALKVGSLGDYLREQRHSAQLSLRQLAAQTGVSNPYLSQVERGLRKPSAEVLQQLAKALRISAEAMYVRAGLLEDPGSDRTLEAAVLSDSVLSERQKRVLLDIYASFRRENLAEAERSAADAIAEAATAEATTAAPTTARAAPPVAHGPDAPRTRPRTAAARPTTSSRTSRTTVKTQTRTSPSQKE